MLTTDQDCDIGRLLEHDLRGPVEKLKAIEPDNAKAKMLTDASKKARGLTAALAQFE